MHLDLGRRGWCNSRVPVWPCRPSKTADLGSMFLASRRCRADSYGLRSEVVTEHGDPPVADAEDLHE